MKILGLILYRDGGTVEITTTKKSYCIDGRMGSKTRGAWFVGYPESDNSNMILDEHEVLEIKSLVRDGLIDFIDPPSEGLKNHLLEIINLELRSD